MHKFHVVLGCLQENYFIPQEGPWGKVGNELVMRAHFLSIHEPGPGLHSVRTFIHFSSSGNPVVTPILQTRKLRLRGIDLGL